jgi:hypothetical protein
MRANIPARDLELGCRGDDWVARIFYNHSQILRDTERTTERRASPASRVAFITRLLFIHGEVERFT